MKVFLVHYGEELSGIFDTWDKAEAYIEKRIDAIHKESGYNVLSDFSVSTEEVQ